MEEAVRMDAVTIEGQGQSVSSVLLFNVLVARPQLTTRREQMRDFPPRNVSRKEVIPILPVQRTMRFPLISHPRAGQICLPISLKLQSSEASFPDRFFLSMAATRPTTPRLQAA